MPLFEARVITERGSVSAHTIEAPSLEYAQQLAEGYGQLLTIKKKLNIDLSRKMTTDERHNFLLRLAALTSANISVGRALEKIESSYTSAIKHAAGNMKRRIDAGMELDVAIALDKKNFKPATSALVRAGLHAGSTSDAIEAAVAFEEALDEAFKGATGRFVWALLGFNAAFIINYVCNNYLAPMVLNNPIMKNNEAINVDWALTASSILIWFIGLAALTYNALFLLATLGRKVAPVLAETIIKRVNGYNEMLLSQNVSVACFKMSLMLNAGMSIPHTLRYTEMDTPNGVLKRDLIRAQKLMDQGSEWTDGLVSLHSSDREAIGCSTSDRDQAKTLRAISNFYKKLYASKVNSIGLSAYLSAALCMIIVGAIVLAITLLPTMQLTASIA